MLADPRTRRCGSTVIRAQSAQSSSPPDTMSAPKFLIGGGRRSTAGGGLALDRAHQLLARRFAERAAPEELRRVTQCFRQCRPWQAMPTCGCGRGGENRLGMHFAAEQMERRPPEPSSSDMVRVRAVADRKAGA